METNNWNNLIETHLRYYFMENILQDKYLMEYLSLLKGEDLGNVLLGLYYLDESQIMKVSQDNYKLLIKTFLTIIIK